MELAPGVLGALLAHLLYALLGVAVLALGPRAPANRAFAIYSVGSGLAGAFGRAAAPLGLDSGIAEATEAALWVVGGLGIVALAAAFPEPLGPADRRSTRLALALAALLGAVLAVAWVRDFPRPVPLVLPAFSLLMVTSAAGAVLFAARAVRAPRSLASYGAMALAVFAPTAFYCGRLVTLATGGRDVVFASFGVLCLAAVAAAWLVAAVRLAPRRWAIAVSWGTLASALAAQLATTTARDPMSAYEATLTGVRLLVVAPLAFLIVRGQVPGLETKVRWTVSRGTIAAAFVAAFFVASEGAQIVFGGGNEWVGLLAAGALVFAIAPLQRAAERLAERAVPVAAPTADAARAGGDAHDPEGLFLNALRVALRDKRLTREEEAHLYRLAAGLGIDAGRAHALLVQAEREMARPAREVA